MAYINKSKTDVWLTPLNLYTKYMDQGYWDPCPYPRSSFDGLKIPWKQKTFCNPPYSQLSKWAKKCYEESLLGKQIVLLIPCRSGTRYFHKYILPFAKIEFIQGRLKFRRPCGTPGKAAPFPSILCTYNAVEK